jgi:hypothetical protein
MEVLLGPEHAGQRLTHHPRAIRVGSYGGRGNAVIEIISLSQTFAEDVIELLKRSAHLSGSGPRQP